MAAELIAIAAGRLESPESMGTGEQTHALIGTTKALADTAMAPQNDFNANAVMDRLMRNFSTIIGGNKEDVLRSIKDARLFAIAFVDSLPPKLSPSLYTAISDALLIATSGRI